MSKTKNPIGTTFKKENIFLATVDYPMTPDEVDAFLKNQGYDVSAMPEGKNFLELIGMAPGSFSRQEVDIFYKDENGYTRFFVEGNETIAGDDSDGKGKIYNIVPACKYYRVYELVEGVNDKGEPCIVDCVGEGENNPLNLYNRDYNLKPK